MDSHHVVQIADDDKGLVQSEPQPMQAPVNAETRRLIDHDDDETEPQEPPRIDPMVEYRLVSYIEAKDAPTYQQLRTSPIGKKMTNPELDEILESLKSKGIISVQNGTGNKSENIIRLNA